MLNAQEFNFSYIFFWKFSILCLLHQRIKIYHSVLDSFPLREKWRMLQPLTKGKWDGLVGQLIIWRAMEHAISFFHRPHYTAWAFTWSADWCAQTPSNYCCVVQLGKHCFVYLHYLCSLKLRATGEETDYIITFVYVKSAIGSQLSTALVEILR